MPTYLSEHVYTADGNDTDFAFNKGYLSRSHVVVKISDDDGATFESLVDGEDYEWVDSQTIRFTEAPAADAVVWLDRETPLSLLVTYENGAVFTDDNQNTAYRHAIYVLQEHYDDLQRRPELNPLQVDAEHSLANAFVSDISRDNGDLLEDKRDLDIAIGRDENNRLTVVLSKAGSTQETNDISEIGVDEESTLQWAQNDWQKAYATYTDQAAMPNLVATGTQPSGQNVFTPSGSRVLVAALADAAAGADVRVTGWRKIGSVWFPELLLYATASGDSGITGDGTQIDASLKFPQTHSGANGSPDRNIYTGGSYNAFGLVAINHVGCQLVQVDARIVNTGTKANAIASFA